jgi:hypothetical protein
VSRGVMGPLFAIAALSMISACGPSTPAARTPKRPHPTDADACPRFCEALAACGGAPDQCETDCRRDAERLRPGFAASYTACIERQLEPPQCGAPVGSSVTVPASRRENVQLCYFATLEAYATRDEGASMRRVIGAVCKRQARCAGATSNEETCKGELDKHTKKGEARILAAARVELVETVAHCIEERPCDDDDPVGPCFTSLGTEATP